MAMSLKRWHQAPFTMTKPLKQMEKANTPTIAGLMNIKITSTMLAHGNIWFTLMRQKEILRLTCLQSSLTLAAT